MSAPKFTPGPWHRNIKPADKYPVVWAGRNTHVAVLALGVRHGKSLSEDQLEANLDLISAAPDMYEALAEAIKWNATRGNEDEILPAEKQCSEIALAMRALAKAEGRQS